MSTSITTGKKLHRQSPAVVSVGCGCSRPKLANLFFRQWPKRPTSSSTKADPSYSLSPSESFTPTAASTSITTPTSTSPTTSDGAVWPKIGMSGRIKESFAVFKDSHDPYTDFRRSMLQMIVEKKIYSKEELQELLTCFLFLNSPEQYEVIIKAFVEIWNKPAYSSPETMKSKER